MPNTTEKYPKGSEWRRWDLHVHTKGTNKNDGFISETFDVFCIKLFKKALQDNIAAIGVTDYFSVDNYKKVLEFVNKLDELVSPDDGSQPFSAEEKNRIKDILILPNVELRMMPATGSGRLINLHCIFNPSFLDHIEDDFFGSLDYSAGSSTPFKMTRAGLMGLGRSQDSALSDEAAYKKGVNTFVVSHGDLQKLHDTNSRFRENVIIVVSNSTSDGASGLQKHYDLFENEAESQLDAVRKSLYSISDAIFSGNPEDRKYFLGEKGDEKTTVIQKCRSLKSCFHGCDAHTEEKLFAPDSNRYCWIKADPSFDGLKQVIWEPKYRVMIQERNPSDSKSGRTVIASASFENSSGKAEVVYFNPDLNAIIGARGSGKSTLLKNIAEKIDLEQYNERDPKPPYLLQNFTVKWGDEQTNSGSDDSPKSTFYIPQGYLSALAYDDGIYAKKRDQFLTDLLKKNSQFSNAIDSFDGIASENKVWIEGLIEKLLADNNSFKEASKHIKKLGSKSEIEAEIKKKEAEISKYKKEIKSDISDADLKVYTEAKKIVSDSKRKFELLDQDKKILVSLSQEGATISVSDRKLGLLSLERQEFIISEILRLGQSDIRKLASQEIEKIDKEISVLDGVLKSNVAIVEKLDDQIKKSKALEDLTNELADLQKIQERIGELSGKIDLTSRARVETTQALLTAYSEFKSQQDVIYKTIKFDKDFTFLNIDIVTRYNQQKIKDFVERNINTRDTKHALKQDEAIIELFSEFPSEPNLSTVEKIINGLLDGDLVIKVEAGDIGNVLSQLLRNRLEIDYLNSVKTKDGGINFKDMTGGQKAIAMLELIFRFDNEKYPILIDQPEDDLDVSGVATDLVDFIKTEKLDRQIIVVSHNASLVVCSDAEEVIACSNIKISEGQHDFIHKTGSIENPLIRDEIIQTLEGGREALMTRARKLNFKKDI